MLAISMRMMRHTYPGGMEIRDALAGEWWHFLEQALPNIPVIPLPNIGQRIAVWLQKLPVSGLILSGGDDWGVFPQRDATEREMVCWAESRGLPILGVCRGAQVLNRLMGGQTGTGFGAQHAGTRHIIHSMGRPICRQTSLEVNSYHNCGIRQTDLAPGLIPLALADDGSIEAFSSADGRLTGIMWHPEREAMAQEHDIHLFSVLNWGQP